MDKEPVKAEDKDDEQPRRYWKDTVAQKWLSKNIGREVEFYMQRAPRVQGILRAVDERFGRVVVESENEDVIVWLGQITQIRMPHDNGRPKRGADKQS